MSLSPKAQIAHDLSIFSEDGSKFSMTVNGRDVTDGFVKNIELKDIQEDYVKVLINFEDTGIPPLSRTVYLAKAGTGEKPPMTSVYVLKTNKKGEWKLRLESTSEKKIQQDQQIIINLNK